MSSDPWTSDGKHRGCLLVSACTSSRKLKFLWGWTTCPACSASLNISIEGEVVPSQAAHSAIRKFDDSQFSLTLNQNLTPAIFKSILPKSKEAVSLKNEQTFIIKASPKILGKGNMQRFKKKNEEFGTSLKNSGLKAPGDFAASPCIEAKTGVRERLPWVLES